MVGSKCVLGSACFSLVALPSTHIDGTSKTLSSTFMGARFPSKTIVSKNQERVKDFVIVNGLGGQYDFETFSDVKAQIYNLFTMIAATTVRNQLYETSPTQYRWFNDFVKTYKPTDRKRFLRILQKENPELAETVMVTRLHLFGKWIKHLDHDQMYKDLSDQNLELMRERLMEIVKLPGDDTDTSNYDSV